ncbi:hypothetical protein REC12_12090 [Desulfosporosinus sp. PR]|uniref:hypothetical protein n=1 Tax=Candidatus Desulfosporosinus nitrosoreducens TaxID=3401928 RepID=UPI0027FBBF75|nr:hypothetical protein [Desulfosporosinus sp. PR]MDQ7094331.1 hypothetical protein [Desulfosporosinus sp. PR]
MYLKKRLLILLTIVFLFTTLGCSKNKGPTTGPPLNSVQQISERYGESHPEITRINPDLTDGIHQPMFLVSLKGNFSKEHFKATRLNFSILADGSKVWAIRASDENNTEIWLDNE